MRSVPMLLTLKSEAWLSDIELLTWFPWLCKWLPWTKEQMLSVKNLKKRVEMTNQNAIKLTNQKKTNKKSTNREEIKLWPIRNNLKMKQKEEKGEVMSLCQEQSRKEQLILYFLSKTVKNRNNLISQRRKQGNLLALGIITIHHTPKPSGYQ